jgi:hypothetical protein
MLEECKADGGYDTGEVNRNDVGTTGFIFNDTSCDPCT